MPLEGGGGEGFDVVPLDADLDGDVDLYVANDHGHLYQPNALLLNDGGVFTPSAACTCDLVQANMGADAADLNGDGLDDLLLSDAHGAYVLTSLPDGSYVDSTVALGLRSSDPEDAEMGWGVRLFDWDNDGARDLLLAQGWLEFEVDEPSKLGGQANPGYGLELWEQVEDGFDEVGEGLGLDQVGNFRSLVTADWNGDGVLDIVATRLRARPHVYLSEGCTRRGWLAVEAPPGSRVEVVDAERVQVELVHRDAGLASGGPARVHVGLGDEHVVERLTVWLPDGDVVELEELDADRVVKVRAARR